MDFDEHEVWRIWHCQACKRQSPCTVLVEAPLGTLFTNGHFILELCPACFADEDLNWLQLQE